MRILWYTCFALVLEVPYMNLMLLTLPAGAMVPDVALEDVGTNAI